MSHRVVLELKPHRSSLQSRWSSLPLAALALVSLVAAAVGHAAPGDLDATFDRTAYLTDLAIQGNGKIVAVGSIDGFSTGGMAIARYDANGMLDPTFGSTSPFGSNGKMAFPVDGGAGAVAIQPDGKIVVACTYHDHLALIRFNDDGTTDPAFAFGDLVDTPVGTGPSQVTAVALQSDGKIVVAGFSSNGSNDDFAVVRWNADGTLDLSFDGDGKVITAIASGDDRATEVKIQADGKILVAGFAVLGSSEDFAMVHYNSNGSIDNTFGSFGRVATDFGSARSDIGYSMAIQPDGKIIMAGYSMGVSNADVGVARYNANGALDPSFGGDGMVTTPIGLSDDLAVALALEPDGKLVVAGAAVIGANTEFAVLRYQSDGTVDQTYGVGGKVVLDFAGGSDIAEAVALDGTGRAVVGGYTYTSFGNFVFGVARFLGDPATTDVPFERDLVPVSAIRRVEPNPASGTQTLFVDVVPGRGVPSLSVFWVTGQRVWTRDLSSLSAGSHRVEWQGRQFDGRTAPPGI